MTARYAVYYAPASDDPLWKAGCAWLGRDPAGGEHGSPPGLAGIGAMTAGPRGYGFHATLKPPMRLRAGATLDDLRTALHAMARATVRFALPPLAVTEFHGFLCLRESRDDAALQALCDAAVASLDFLRAPPGDVELARRRGAGLSPVREANLLRWGYPDVFGAWFFHMTLTRRLDTDEMRIVRPAAEAWFEDALSQPRWVDDVCLFEQLAGEDFRLTDRVRLAV